MVENLRQICLFKVANESGKPWLWWDYVTDFAIRCPMKEKKYNKECADRVIKSLGRFPEQFSGRFRCTNHCQFECFGGIDSYQLIQLYISTTCCDKALDLINHSSHQMLPLFSTARIDNCHFFSMFKLQSL